MISFQETLIFPYTYEEPTNLINGKELGINLGSQLGRIQTGGQPVLRHRAAKSIYSFCLTHQSLVLKQNKETQYVSPQGRISPQRSSETCWNMAGGWS